uniref:Aldehyde oxidase n=1 Tax=Ostrinia furnacalis TaxID=93504 RepID=A0A0F7QEA3_OSTFU|nr:aldehyde oxidase [Ostrinia furnacalis]
MDKVYFTINGEHYSLSGSEVSPTTSLNEYLRDYLQLHGTKAMCREGGCGACIVAVARPHPVTKEKHTVAVNSCLVHVLSCHQWDITTVEGVGNRKDGYHAIQSRLAAFNGTQCGYCTPGWVMNMYSLYEGAKQRLSTGDVEDSFGGNICRCTGYRPILDAFKSFATDASPELQNKVLDLEDLHKVKCAQKCERRCSVIDDEWCVLHNKQESMLQLEGPSSRWYKAFTLQDVFQILAKEGLDSYKLVAGNTGQGVFSDPTQPRIFIDISSIEALKDNLIDVNLVIGAGTTLTELISVFRSRSSHNDFSYMKDFVEHLELVAHVPVRNTGTIGGNLAMKNAHHDFPSDLFILLETVNATVTVVNHTLSEKTLTMQDFLNTDLKNHVITNFKMPPLSHSNKIRSYKIMPRAQNALAIVNAGFAFKLDSNNKIEQARIVFSPISSSFIHATETENFLKGKELFNEEVLKSVLKKLEEEIVPVDDPPVPSPLCRKTIALGLFYKAVLSLCPAQALNPRYASGATMLSRGISTGTQTFDTDKSLWPLNKPVPKLEALTQCSGEAKYACDVSSTPRDVHVAFVLSKICLGEIESFDASQALKIPGVVAFYTAKDIPGKNTFVPTNVPWASFEEEILASKEVSYYGQPVALVAAVSHAIALKAADLVKVVYKKSSAKPVLSIEEALVAPDKDRRIREDVSKTATGKGENTSHVIKGSFIIPSQYHFTMETQCCSVSNTELGVHVRSATQWMDLVHVAVANALDIEQNRVLVSVPRVGGAYGGKASRSALAACACALVSRKLNRTATLVMPLTHNMAAIGKRQRCRADYELGVDDEGVIQYLNLSYYMDCGFNFNDTAGSAISDVMALMYQSSTWTVKGYSVLTDTAGNTWCRAPGTNEATAIVEHLMERIAHVTKKDPIEVRIKNITPEHISIKDMIDTLKNDSNYNERKAQIATFNAENAWKKRGIKLCIMSFPIDYSWNFPVTVSVYHGDATVAITHGGIEMGQGINTKVAQVCAYTLKVPLEKVTVFGSDSLSSPNAMASNGSITSDCVAYATVKSCTELLKRLESVKNEMNDPSWEQLVQKAFEKGVNLQTSYMTGPLDSPAGYNIHGACACEVELDVLTGQHAVTRVDLIEDVGVSISPDIDVGQIEGAFIMGLGLWTSEQLAYEPSSGRLLTDRTWTYHPPGAKDIPVDFRVAFQKNSINTAGVLRSKATGEPALTLAVTVPLALHDAIVSARKEFGYADTEWLDVDAPYSVENILKAISPKTESFQLK